MGQLRWMIPKDVIEEALNLSSVIGVVLLRKTELPCFFAKENVLEQQQQYTLACYIENIVETMPESMKAFDFPVMDFYAYAYLLKPEVTFVILALRRDINIKLLSTRSLETVINQHPEQVIAFFEAENEGDQSGKELEQKVSPGTSADASPKVVLEGGDCMGTLLQDLNGLSQIVCKYLGPQLTARYWTASQPNVGWIEQFQINDRAKITFAGNLKAPVLAVNYSHLEQWTGEFIQQCSQIIRDLPQKISQQDVNLSHKPYLSVAPISHLVQVSSFDRQEDSIF